MSQIFKYLVLSPKNSKSYGLLKVQLINWELVFCFFCLKIKSLNVMHGMAQMLT